RENKRGHVIPAAERLVVIVAAMPLDRRLKPAPRNRFEKTGKDAIAVLHARFLLSLDNQKVTGLCRFYRACIRGTVTHSPDSPARKRGPRSHGSSLALDSRFRGNAEKYSRPALRWRAHG